MMREMMSMHPGMARGGPVCPTCGGPAHRAAGGPAGGYMVGERGPEMFMPDQPGTVIPHHELIRLARKYGGHVSNKRRR